MENDLREFLARRLKVDRDAIALHRIEEAVYTVTLDTESRVLQQPSRRRVNQLSRDIRIAFGVDIAGVIVSDRASSLAETWAEQILATQLGLKANAILVSSIESDGYELILDSIEKLRDNAGEIDDTAKAILSSALEKAGFRIAGIRAQPIQRPRPSRPQILRELVIRQPACVSELVKAFDFDDADASSQKWLASQIDQLRKSGLVIGAGKNERSERLYSLTLLGIDAIPPQRGRNSSDVRRALALGRRKWQNNTRSGGDARTGG